MKKGKLFIISAPSGAGKTSIVKKVINELKDAVPIEKVITFTTRPKRQNETHGTDYFFLSPQEFLNKKKQDFFLETTEYNEHFYGSPKTVIQDIKKGNSFIIIADTKGAKKLKSSMIPDVITIWITVPSLEILRERLKKRHFNNHEFIKKRLKIAQDEIAQGAKERVFDYHVMNESLEEAVNNVVSIIKNELGIRTVRSAS